MDGWIEGWTSTFTSMRSRSYACRETISSFPVQSGTNRLGGYEYAMPGATTAKIRQFALRQTASSSGRQRRDSKSLQQRSASRCPAIAVKPLLNRGCRVVAQPMRNRPPYRQMIHQREKAIVLGDQIKSGRHLSLFHHQARTCLSLRAGTCTCCGDGAVSATQVCNALLSRLPRRRVAVPRASSIIPPESQPGTSRGTRLSSSVESCNIKDQVSPGTRRCHRLEQRVECTWRALALPGRRSLALSPSVSATSRCRCRCQATRPARGLSFASCFSCLCRI